VNKSVTIDLAHAVPATAPLMPVHPQSLLDLPAGEARDSLLAVHGILGTRLSPRYPEMRARKPFSAALIDAAATVLNALLPGKGDVRHGDYQVILRKR